MNQKTKILELFVYSLLMLFKYRDNFIVQVVPNVAIPIMCVFCAVLFMYII